MKTLEINGRTFEVIKKRTARTTPNIYRKGGINDLYNWYERPSQYKQNIWNDWLDWAYNTEGIIGFQISSANCMQFTIMGTYIKDNITYNLYITKDHNRAYIE